MGQYWWAVNLDKREFIDAHRIGTGLKLWEQLAGHTGKALVILTAAMPMWRGGGDFDIDENWHGPERLTSSLTGDADAPHRLCPGPMPEDYPEIAARTIGRWAGDRIAIVGDLAEDSDLPAEFRASSICERCCPADELDKPADAYLDVTADVAAVIEHELRGKFVGEFWKWEPNPKR